MLKIEKLKSSFWFNHFKNLIKTTKNRLIMDVTYCTIGNPAQIDFHIMENIEDQMLILGISEMFIVLDQQKIDLYAQIGDTKPIIGIKLQDIKAIHIHCHYMAIK